MTEPVALIRGAAAIADHLGISTQQCQHFHRSLLIPTFRVANDSAPHATAGGLDEWLRLGTLAQLTG